MHLPIASIPLTLMEWKKVDEYFKSKILAPSVVKNPRTIFGDYVIFCMGIYTAFRISEILSVTFEDIATFKNIYDGQGVPHVEFTILPRLTVARKMMKGQRESRTVKIPPTLMVLLHDYLSQWEITFSDNKDIAGWMKVTGNEKNHYPLFPSLTLWDSPPKSYKRPFAKMGEIYYHGLNPNVVYDRMASIFKKLGIDWHSATHKMRKSCATLNYERGLNLIQMKEFLGHRSVATTEKYLCINKAEVEEKSSTLDWNFEANKFMERNKMSDNPDEQQRLYLETIRSKYPIKEEPKVEEKKKDPPLSPLPMEISLHF